MPTVAADETWERLGAAAQLLHHAALRVWTRAEDQPPELPLQSFGLGVSLAKAQISALLPDDCELCDLEVDPDEMGARELLSAAEGVTRGLPLHRPDLAGVSQLVVDLGELVREARDLGC